MKKSYFMRILNITIFLFVTALFALFLVFLSNHIITSLDKSDITFIRQASNVVKTIIMFISRLGMLSATVAVLIITVEIISRFKSDKIINYFKSVYSTMLLRHFLTQTERTEKVMTIEGQTITTYNPINNTFNRAVRKSVVDIRQNCMRIIIKMPSKQQAQKILKEMEPQIKEELANRNPDYYFSAPTKGKNALWFEGKRR
ncbi:hypothetical protein D9Y92_02575 [Enterococcus faecium]|nr:hypothetical protein [Enterococcus faecium]EGP5297497.1 hypothetical protein [Enterococcus faecium]EME7098297.1 hypothetical protein [Enterococcus faecium]EME7130910.1 hypothetical protein [Enterococcus faecium]EME8182805.1 hypothetical protein [Enterococcus faecium]